MKQILHNMNAKELKAILKSGETGVFINAFDATFSRTRSSQFQEGQSQL